MSIQSYWYRERLHPLLFPLLPFAFVFRGLVKLRRLFYQFGICKTYRFPVPVIIVGNITVGGTGKTPFVQWLVQALKEQGKNPGIALRGVGGNPKKMPTCVTPSSDPLDCGDEAVLLARHTSCPVVACIDRVAAVKRLLELKCDIIVCDDGLQHYRLGRDIEIALIDGNRYFGNGFSLPAGPLREPLSRLQEVDFIVLHQQESFPDSHYRINNRRSFPMRLQADRFISVHDSQKHLALSAFASKKVHAVAGIGHPQNFFELLRHLDVDFIPHIFPDHHPYRSQDLAFEDNLDIVMTEKDAVKCQHLGQKDRLWYLRVNTEVHDELKKELFFQLNQQRNSP